MVFKKGEILGEVFFAKSQVPDLVCIVFFLDLNGSVKVIPSFLKPGPGIGEFCQCALFLILIQ